MIKIDMEMPENCEDCRFLLHIDNKATCYASVTLQEIDDIEAKPKWCPLIECEDEKSCKTCKYYEVLDGYRICNADECTNYSAWERK